MPPLSDYRAAITHSICSVCRKPDDNGLCDLTSREQCAIERYLERIVEAVTGVHSGRYEDYVAAIRASVCARCESGDALRCDDRGTDICLLDRYLPLIIEAVERVNSAN
jgi:hypothetical protein